MQLPIVPPYPPMEAKLVRALPRGEGWLYEPKWDGFRCVAFRDGDELALQSKAGQPLARYFPEVVAALQSLAPTRFVLDGELVIPEGDAFSFDALLQRIHPAASRVQKLAHQTPATYLLFDFLVDEAGAAIGGEPLRERRARLEKFYADYVKRPDIRLSPATSDPDVVEAWHAKLGARALDGVVAKRLEMAYQSGNRHGMQKVKVERTAECVVGGFRYAAKERVVGSFLLGLYDDEGVLHHCGFCASFNAQMKQELLAVVEPLRGGGGFTGAAPGGPSRWANERTGEWEALTPTLVVEIGYDHFSGGRFRHGTRFIRFRPDKDPRACTYDQVAERKSDAIFPA
jgi:ATP-dependent DNA ligase